MIKHSDCFVRPTDVTLLHGDGLNQWRRHTDLCNSHIPICENVTHVVRAFHTNRVVLQMAGRDAHHQALHLFGAACGMTAVEVMFHICIYVNI